MSFFKLVLSIKLFSIVSSWNSPVFPTEFYAALAPEHSHLLDNEANITEFPFAVSIEQFGKHFCGGSIVSKKWILTAAYCFSPLLPLSFVKIRSGSAFTRFGGTEHRVKQVVIHDKYEITNTSSTVNDIALAMVHPPFRLNTKTRKIVPLDDKGYVMENSQATAVGWGHIKTDQRKFMHVLQRVSIPIFNKEQCNKLLHDYGGLAVGQFCADYFKSCQEGKAGDSGGPLIIDNKLVGITAWGKGCAKISLPGVYTQVSHYRGWVEEFIAEKEK